MGSRMHNFHIGKPPRPLPPKGGTAVVGSATLRSATTLS